MAQGFRDCCNEFSYFTLTEIPATVSEFETYYIRTTQGLTFCASYVNIPPLNYNLPVFVASEIVQQTSCNTCIGLYPCTTDEAIILQQFGEGSIIDTYDCNFSTILPMNVNCLSVNPTYNNTNDGKVIVSATGGLPPYTFTVNGGPVINYTRIDNTYVLLPNAIAGIYNIIISDSSGDFIIPLQCTLTAPPPPPRVQCNTTDATFYGKPDGLLDFTIIDGTPPFTFYLNGTPINLPYTVPAGTYTIFYTDQYYQDSIICTVGEPPEVQYPDVLCMTFIIGTTAGCSQSVSLNFYKEITKYNYRAWYTCSNAYTIGLPTFDLKWQEEICTQICAPVEPGWYVSGQFNGFIQWNSDCPYAIAISADLTTNFKKLSATPTPLNEQPVGAWTQVSGDFTATNISVTQDVCPPVARVLSTVGVCTDTRTLGSALVTAEGGSGPPYTFTVRNTDNSVYRTYQPDVVSMTDLVSQNYLLTVTDGQGNQSLPVPFTIGTIRGFVFDSGTITPCVNYRYLGEWVNQNPFGQPSIEAGESFVDTIYTESNIYFPTLPASVQISGRLVLEITYGVTVGQVGYTDPNVLFNYLPNTVFNTIRVTTNSVSTTPMDGVIPIDVPQAYTLNGTWYQMSLGSPCCGNPSIEGVSYSRIISYSSSSFIMNNTTEIATAITNKLINSIPYYVLFSRTCPAGNFCGGNASITLKMKLTELRVVSGCGTAVVEEKLIYSYRFLTNSLNPYSPTWNALPSPACASGGK